MIIRRKELDPEILTKLDQLDKVVSGFDENAPEGCVSYGRNGFYFKKLTNESDKIVYKEDEIVELENSLHSKNRNILSSFETDFRLSKIYHSAARKFLYDLDYSYVYDFSSSIVISKLFSDSLVVINANGIFIKESTNTRIELIKKIKENFSVSSQFEVYDICDIAEIDFNNYLIATNNFGIYKLSLEKSEIELVCNILNVKAIEYGHNRNIFIATDDFVGQYDIKTGLRVEKYTNVKSAFEVPKKIIKTNDGIFVLAVPAGIQISNKLLHFWKLDDAGVGYNLKDGLIENHSLDNSYQILYSFVDDDYLYLAGKNGHQLFVWKYSLKTYQLAEEFIDNINAFTGFAVINGYYIILSGNMLYVIKDNEIQMRLKLKHNCSNLAFKDGELFTKSSKHIFKIALPNFINGESSLSYVIYRGKEPCNNIDIFVKNANRNERISLFDIDTGKEINPSYYMIYNNNSIIKLTNCKSLNIKMSIVVNEKTSLGGIVVKNNRLFLKQ